MNKLLSGRNLTLSVDSEVKNFLIDREFDPDFGARPLRRAVERYIEDPLAEELLRGEFNDASGVAVKLDKQKILIFPEK